MKMNVKNIPLNTVYRFDVNKYVLSTMLDRTRDGQSIFTEPKKFTEIYQISEDGVLLRIASGTLIDNPEVYDFNRGFAIKDYDKDMILSFKVPFELQEVGLKELYELRLAIEKNYNKRNNINIK